MNFFINEKQFEFWKLRRDRIPNMAIAANFGISRQAVSKALLTIDGKIENAIKRTIRVIEFDDDVTQFIKNYAYPLRDIEVSQDGKKVVIKGKDTKTRAMIIGRERSNLKKMLETIQRYFDVEDIQVV